MNKIIIFYLAFLFISCGERQSSQEQSDTIPQHVDIALKDTITNNTNKINDGCLCDYVEDEYSNCDTSYFDNKTKLYWLCAEDSVWLTFKTKENKKVVIYSQPYFDHRLGTHFIKEYPKALVFSHHWISGCCQTPDVFFIDKVTGKETKRIASREYIYEDYDNGILVYFTDSTFNKIEVLDMISNKTYTKSLPDNRIASTNTPNSFPFVASLFEEPLINKRSIRLPYKYTLGNNKNFIKDTIAIYR